MLAAQGASRRYAQQAAKIELSRFKKRNEKIKYADMGMKDAQVDKYLTTKQQTLPPRLQKEIVQVKDEKRWESLRNGEKRIGYE